MIAFRSILAGLPNECYKKGHLAVVGLIPVVKPETFRRPTAPGRPVEKKASQDERSVLASAIHSEVMHVATAPLRRDRLARCGTREYTAAELPFEPTGGYIERQLLPGGGGHRAPVQFCVTAHVGDGVEMCSVLLSASNWCAVCGCPPHLLGCPDPGLYHSPVPDDKLLADCGLGKTLFDDHWIRGERPQKAFIDQKKSSGRIPGRPYGVGGTLPAAQTAAPTDRLHGKGQGAGRTGAGMTMDGLGETTGWAALTPHLQAFSSSPGGRNLPRTHPLVPRTGEEGRTLHELIPLAILCEFEVGEEDGTLSPTLDNQLLLLRFWLHCVAWAGNASRKAWAMPADFDTHQRLGEDTKTALWALRVQLKAWTNEDNTLPSGLVTRSVAAVRLEQDAFEEDHQAAHGWPSASGVQGLECAKGSRSGFKQHTAFHDAEQAVRLGPEGVTDTGSFEEHNKSLHQMGLKMTNSQERTLISQMARAIQRTNLVPVRLKEYADLDTGDAGPDPKRGFGPHRMTGAIALFELAVDEAKLIEHREALRRFEAGVWTVSTAATVRWRRAAFSCALALLSGVSGDYEPATPPTWAGDGDVNAADSDWLCNTTDATWWLQHCRLNETDGVAVADLKLHWATPARRTNQRTLLGEGSTYGGAAHFVFKHNCSSTGMGPRPALDTAGLIDGPTPSTTSVARLDFDVTVLPEPSILPPCPVAPDLPLELPELLRLRCGGGGTAADQQQRPVHIVYEMMGAAVTPTGGLSATSNYYKTHRPRRSVARMGESEGTVCVRSLLRVNNVLAGGEEELALVRTLDRCPPPEELSEDAKGAWRHVKLEVYRKGEHEYELCPLAELSAIDGYSTQTADPDGQGPVAFVAPWVGNH